MSTYAELWTRPGDAAYGRVLDDLPATLQGLHDGVNLFGDGNMVLPDTFSGLDSILFIDHLAPANSVSSTVKLFDDSDPTTPIFEWIPNSILPAQSKDDHLVDVAGDGIKSIIAYGRVDAFDWDGSDDFECQSCDWIWGGNNALGNPDFETSTVTPTTYSLTITATGGTYTLSDGVDPTSAIAWDATAATIATRLQTDIASITDVNVDNIATGPTTFGIDFVVPAFGVALTVNPGGLTGGTATLTLTQEGGLSPSPWTRAQSLVNGIDPNLGNYTVFEVSDEQNHTPGGTYSLKIDPGPIGVSSFRLPGAQQVISVSPSSTNQASLWVYPTSGTDLFRLGIFGEGEEFIAWTSSSGTTLTPNVWNQLVISDVVIPDDVSRVIFRIACTNIGPSNPSVFYIDDGEFNEGLSPTTAGRILRLLYDQMTDTTLYSTIFWNNEAVPGTPYLTLDFSDSVDSGGAAWFESEITMRVWMRMTLKNVLDSLVTDYGIEWRVVPNNVELGTYLLQVYNPGTMKVDYTSAIGPAIQGGSSDVRRQVVRLLPKGTDMMVEGLGRLTGRDRDANLIGALGSIASSRLDKALPELSAVGLAAFEDRLNSLTDGLTYIYSLINPQDIPLVAYGLGDLLVIHDPPEVNDDARLADVTASLTPNSETWTTVFVPATTQGS